MFSEFAFGPPRPAWPEARWIELAGSRQVRVSSFRAPGSQSGAPPDLRAFARAAPSAAGFAQA
eukprot:11226497-Lingulodinium_polyedra.AAC.1